MKHLTALVTGASTFMGSAMVKNLVDDGYDVLAVDNEPVERWRYIDKDAESIQVDLSNWEKVKSLVYDDDDVYNFSACTHGIYHQMHANTTECLEASTINMNMLKATKMYGGRKYFLSSSANIYPVRMQLTSKVTRLNEAHDWMSNPSGIHGAMNLFNERACKEYCDWNRLDYRIARYFNVYGPGSDWDNGNEGVIPALCRKVAIAVLGKEKSINVWGNGRETRSFIYIDDAIDAARILMDPSGPKIKGALNIGPSNYHQIDDIIDIIFKIADTRLSITYDNSGPVGVTTRVCDSTMSDEIMHWKPATSIEDGIQKTYEWVYDKVRDTYF